MLKKLFASKNIITFIVLAMCLAFFAAYSVLSVTRHNNFQSFGYDLGINHQVVWRYSTFQLPITTSDPFPSETKLSTHVELIYLLISPFYWIWSTARMLLIVDALFMSASAFAVYLLAKRKKLHPALLVALPFSYLMFYGVQNAMWFDVHSASFAAGFLMWFIYFLDSKKYKYAWVFLFLAITAKENIGMLTLLIASVYWWKYRERKIIYMGLVSLIYLLFIYLVYFPIIIHKSYLYQNTAGLISNLNPLSFIDSPEKREALFYSFASFGFLPLLLPFYLLPAIGDFATYFVLASDLTASHGIYMHYRVTIAPLLIFVVIIALSKYRMLNNIYIALYLFFSTLIVQYALHLPLSYLTKDYFWIQPSGVVHINKVREGLSLEASIVAQNNIVPHISKRDEIYTLYPTQKKFEKNSPCGNLICDWMRWDDHPEYLFVDTSSEWDARHLLTNRELFINGIENMKKAKVIEVFKQDGSAVMYRINYQQLQKYE